MLMTPVAADTSFTFRVPGEESEAEADELGGKIQSMIDTIQSEYYKDVTKEALIEGAFKGMFEVLDQHSAYYTEQEYNAFMEDVMGEFSGVGMYIEMKDEYVTVVAPIEGSPAFEAGIKAGDRIVNVDGKDIAGYTVEKASSIIKGPEGTKVKLGIRREGEKDILYFELIREVIKINPVSYEIKEGNIGYLKITQFNESVFEKAEKAINEFKVKQVKGLVIDLRNNGGGLLDQVIELCKLLVPEGPIVHVEEKGKPRMTYSSQLKEAPFKIVVLVNEGSASASEIMAGAIKDSKAGILIGSNTYGKGTVQNIMPLVSGGGIKLTIANYLTRNANSIDGTGIKPDIEVKPNNNDIYSEYAPIKGDRGLKNSIVGLDVLGLQQRLNAMGYTINKQDGVFGSGTKTAVLKFEGDNKLKQDGILEASEQKVLMQKFSEKASQEDPQLERALVELGKQLNK